jgi:hypothetical protein
MMDRRIRIRQPPIIVAEQIAALGLGQEIVEAAPGFGEDLPHAAHEPLELGRAREKDAAQHEAETAPRVRLRIRECERRAPRAAEHEPALDAEHRAQPLDVGDEMRGRVVGDVGERHRAAGAALIEQHDPPERRIEIAPVMRQATATRAAVQEHDGTPRGLPQASQ